MPARRLHGRTGPINFAASADDRYRAVTYLDYHRNILRLIAARAGMELPPPEPSEISPDSPIRTVVLSEDRWISQCPDCGTNFQFVWPTELLYMCIVCWNAETHGQYRRVVLPDRWEDVDRAAGGVRLAVNRNWIPYDSTVSGVLAGQTKQTAAEVIAEFEAAR